MTAPNGRAAIKAKEKVDNAVDNQIEGKKYIAQEEHQDSENIKIRKEKITQYLKHDFTEEELKEMSDDIARAILERNDATSQLKGLKSQFDSNIKMAEAKISSLAEKLRSKYEYRTTSCVEEINYITGKYILIREDTGKIIKERELTAKESQIEMY